MSLGLCGLVWLVVGLRILRLRGDGTPSRGSMTGALTWIAITVSLLLLDTRFDAMVGLPNISITLRRMALGIAWLRAQEFLVTTVQAGDSDPLLQRRARRRAQWSTGAYMVASVGLWIFGLPHDYEVSSMEEVPGLSTTVFAVLTYLWLLAVAVELTLLGRQACLAFKADPPAKSCGALLMIAGMVGAVGPIGMIVGRLTAVRQDAYQITMPLSGALIAAALVSAPIVEWFHARRVARKAIASMEPRWQEAVEAHPEVVLPLTRFRRWWDVTLVAERMRIELLDAGSLTSPRSHSQ